MTIHERPSVKTIVTRKKLILAGLYLSKYDSLGLKRLGFDNFTEAFNVIGCALGARSASIKNYRDEFDPLFPNSRKGWHKRAIREYCRDVYDEYKDVDFEFFTGLINSFFGFSQEELDEIAQPGKKDDGTSTFAQRLITGAAAEQYFESIHSSLPEFKGYSIENTTRFGCGYDFRLRRHHERESFLAIEVKGLKDLTGTLSMTPKEYSVASALGERFYLFVVRNFQEKPSHSIYQNPLSAGLQFTRAERAVIQISWTVNV